jgi:twitching motility protein PilT
MDKVNTAPIDRFLRTLWEHRGSDLLLVAGAPPMVRIDGALRAIGGEAPLTAEAASTTVQQILGTELHQKLMTEREVDFSFGWEWQARFRGNAFHQRGSLGLALRLIPREIPTFEQLGVPAAVSTLADTPQGLVLVTGPTGSGKSTTLASMIRYISQQRACHILTLEDPIEYHHEHANSIVTQREIGTDSDSFARALRSALREDPDVLLVGEMRDPESIQTTLTIAETGHLVLATLHTNDAAQAIDRIIDVFPAERQGQIRIQLASSLVGVVAQRLLPRLDGGRVAAFELLLANTAVKNLVREGKTEQLRNVIATGQRAGMQTLESNLRELVSRGVIDHEAATNATLHVSELKLAN